METKRSDATPPHGLESRYRLVAELAATPRREHLVNGLTVGVLENHRAPLVSTVLCYRAGTREEPARHAGLAHFLEHMMFRGSRRFGAGEVDRRTLALGGSNNAYTTHDSTVYHFTFTSDRWVEALDMEADRMAGLRLEPEEIDTERAVILEEIGMCEDDPWEALELEVHAALFDGHPYGRPILGTRESLARIGGQELAGFHRRRYRPDNAVLVVAGDVDGGAFEAVADRFGLLPAGAAPAARGPTHAGRTGELHRIVRRRGDLARLLLALPAPAAGAADFAPLRLLLTILGGGRASRLHRALVDERELCLSVSTEIAETVEPGLAEIALEVVTGAEPQEVEARALEEVHGVVEGAIQEEEVARAQRMLLADWVFGFEKIHQQALNAAVSLALFDPDYLQRHLQEILECSVERLGEVGRAYLVPEKGGVIGWSLPET